MWDNHLRFIVNVTLPELIHGRAAGGWALFRFTATPQGQWVWLGNPHGEFRWQVLDASSGEPLSPSGSPRSQRSVAAP